MKVGNIPILWTVIAVVFMKTALDQNKDDRRLGEVDEDGNRVPVTPSAPPVAAVPTAPSTPVADTGPYGRAVRVAAVQMWCGEDRDENLDRAAGPGRRAPPPRAPTLVVLPELFAVLGRNAAHAGRGRAAPRPDPRLGRRAGPRPRRAPRGRQLRRGATATTCSTPRASSAPTAALVAAYRKVHLFDVGVDGAASRESDTFSAGPGPVVAPLGDGRRGPGARPHRLLRPPLPRALPDRGAHGGPRSSPCPPPSPAPPARPTGSCCCGPGRSRTRSAWWPPPSGAPRPTASCATATPWWSTRGAGCWPTPGREGDGVAVADLDLAAIDAVRAELPSLANRRPEAYPWPASVDPSNS